MVKIKKDNIPSSVIKPIIINQDVVENIFCQVRAQNAQNSHPNYALYMNSVNTVSITQTLTSPKSNTGGSNVLPRSELPNPHPFKRTKQIKKTSFNSMM